MLALRFGGKSPVQIIGLLTQSLVTASYSQSIKCTAKSRIKVHPNIDPLWFLWKIYLAFKSTRLQALWVYNQDVLLEDYRVEEKQCFKRLSVHISIKYRKLQCIKKIIQPFNFFGLIAFLVDSLIHICTRYFYPSGEYTFSFSDIIW